MYIDDILTSHRLCAIINTVYQKEIGNNYLTNYEVLFTCAEYSIFDITLFYNNVKNIIVLYFYKKYILININYYPK